MAKDKELVFSSEREEKKGQRKRILIQVGIVLGVIILAVAIALIVRSSRGTVNRGGEDTPYPYTWKNSKGVMTIEIDHSADPERSWMIFNPDPVSAECATAEKQPEGKSRFTFKPLEEGRYEILFFLMGEGDEASMRLSMLVEAVADEKGVLVTDVLSSSLLARQVKTAGGEGTYYPYSYNTDSDGFLVVTLSGVALTEDWDCVSDNENVAVPAGLFYEDGNIIVYMMAGKEAGICGVKIYRTEAEVSLDLGVELTAEGALVVISDKLTGGDIEPLAPVAVDEVGEPEAEYVDGEMDGDVVEGSESSEGEN